MTNKYSRLRVTLLLFIVLATPLSASSDPFMGEGKHGYISRCISSSEMPGRTRSEKKEFCSCFANKLESGYQKVLNSIKQSDSVATVQQKMNNMAQQYAKSCMP